MQAEDRPDATGRIYRFGLHEGYVSGAARAHLLSWSTNQTKRGGETETRLIAEEQNFFDEIFDREDTVLARMRESASGAASAGALAFGGSNDPYRHLPRPGQGAPGSWPTKPLPPPVPLRAKPLLFADRNSAEMEMEDENIDAQLHACREFEEAQRERGAMEGLLSGDHSLRHIIWLQRARTTTALPNSTPPRSPRATGLLPREL